MDRLDDYRLDAKKLLMTGLDTSSHSADAFAYMAQAYNPAKMRTRKLFNIDNVALLFRPGSLWIGAHWSPAMRQWCINLIPCVTLRVRLR